MGWASFIETAPCSDHAVQVYDEFEELVDSVVPYLTAGFASGAPAIVVATADHWDGFRQELRVQGWEVAELERQGLLTYKEAEETLAAFMEGGLPSAARFQETVGALVDDVAARFPGRTIRAFGEMVDLLWRRGETPAAGALEELWNQLARGRRFALLCGYHLDIFDIDVQTAALPDVFATHTHTRPAADPSRLAAAVDRALTEEVGAKRAGRIYLEVAERVPRGPVPRAQEVLSFLSSRDTLLAKRILDRARFLYAAPAMRAAS